MAPFVHFSIKRDGYGAARMLRDNTFAIPYWDYAQPDQRVFPREFGIEHLNGNTEDNTDPNINPLYHAARDYFLCGYEHPFTNQLPLTELSSRAVDDSRVMKCPVFFGDKESEGVGGGINDTLSSTRGLMEQSPHDQVHRAVGGSVEGIADDHGNPTFAMGAMAIPQTAGFDPIFPIHHANMDRLWARWSCMPGKSWGKLPADKWLDEKPWFFFDTNGVEVNRPRRDYFDYKALGVRFKDDQADDSPLTLPPPSVAIVVAESVNVELYSAPAAPMEVFTTTIAISAPSNRPTMISLAAGGTRFESEIKGFQAILQQPVATPERVTLTLHDASINNTASYGYDAYLVTNGTPPESLDRSVPNYLGPISLFTHQREGKLTIDQTFDLTQALAATGSALDKLELVLVPYALAETRSTGASPVKWDQPALTASGFSITRANRNAAAPAGSHSHQ